MTTHTSTDHRLRYILPLDSPSCLATGRVGGKASRLAEMGLNGFPVPAGFVVTTDAFVAFCKHNGIYDRIGDDAKDPALGREIVDGEFPPVLKTEIQKSAAAFGFEAYAVRSSAFMEDGARHSMAGQLDTFLNTPEKDLPDRIKSCWASMFGKAVAAYAHRKSISVAPGMGVIIQEQIDAAAAGVLFTLDPVTRSADHLILEWVMGLGDKLVSGTATPQRRHIRRGAPVHTLRGDMPSPLSDFLGELLSLALKAERMFQTPLDIEWCVTHKGPVLLQARPITGIGEEGRVIWTNVNMVENFPDVLAPFTWSIVDTFYIYYGQHMLKLFGWNQRQLREAESIVHNFTGVQAGRIYYNLSNWYAAAHTLPLGRLFKRLLDNFIGQQVPMDNPVGDTQWGPGGWRRAVQFTLFWLRLPMVFFTAGRHIDTYEKQFYRHRRRWRRTPYGKRSLVELLGLLDRVLHGFVGRYYFNPATVDLLSAIFPGGLKLLAKRWLSRHFANTDLLSAQLMQGVKVKSVEPAELIQTVAGGIASDDKLQRLLLQEKYGELEGRLPKTLQDRLSHFMFRFGGRCYHDCTMATPTFEERHDLFWHLVEKYQRAGNAAGAENDGRSACSKTALKQAMQHLPWGPRWVFRLVLKQAHRAIGLRERSRIVRSLLFGEIRQIALAMGSRLAEKDYLAKDEDLFFLRWAEIKEIACGKYQFPETLPELVAMRKRAFDQNSAIDPPSLFVTDQSAYVQSRAAAPRKKAHPASVLGGVAVSGGRVTATAKVILDPVNHNTLEPGEILVARATDPGWTPLFQIAGGLILEKGGMLSHGAIVAREFGIPAIANVENATTVIRDGQTLRMDGDTGEIRIVARTEEAR